MSNPLLHRCRFFVIAEPPLNVTSSLVGSTRPYTSSMTAEHMYPPVSDGMTMLPHNRKS